MQRHLVLVDMTTHGAALGGRRYAADLPLAELEQRLNPQRFFRATRQVIVVAGKGRRVLRLAPDDETIAVTQERLAAFRGWWERAPGGEGQLASEGSNALLRWAERQPALAKCSASAKLPCVWLAASPAS